MEGEMGGHVARMVSMVTEPKCEFKILSSTHDLELNTLDRRIVFKKECLINL
jgi:hypothetical protein